MALFRKTIVGPAVYHVDTPKGRKLVPVTRKLLKDMCDTANEMLKKGFKIPCPFAHRDGNGTVPGLLMNEDTDAATNEKKQWSSDINAGFWNKFSINKDGQLEGVVEIPGDENDPNSNAYKFGKTIKETSIFYVPEFEDSLGRTWKHVLKHVAAVVRPLEPDQTNFESLQNDPEYQLAMAFAMSDEVNPTKKDDESEGSQDKTATTTSDSDTTQPDKEEGAPDEAVVGNVVRLFKEKLEMEFPPDTNMQNFMDRLLAILTSIPVDKQEDLASEKPKEKSEPETKAQLAMAEDNTVLPKKFEKLFEQYFAQFKLNLKDRIEAAVKAGKIGKRYAENVFYPELESLAMSHDDLDDEGNHKKTEIEIRLEMAEQLDSILDRSENSSAEGTEEKKPEGEEIKASEAELEAVYNMAL